MLQLGRAIRLPSESRSEIGESTHAEEIHVKLVVWMHNTHIAAPLGSIKVVTTAMDHALVEHKRGSADMMYSSGHMSYCVQLWSLVGKQ